MDGYLNWKNDTEEEQKCKHLIGRLQAARNKLTPIIDDIIVSAVDSIQRGDNKFLSECTLTVDQYQDVIWASQILREIEYQCRTDDEKYKLPNSTVIVNNVSVDHKSRMMSVRDKSIVIDEAIVVELLELYEQMGVVIQRMVAERTHASDQPPMPTSAKRITSESSTSERTLRSRSSSRKYVTTTDTSLSDVNEKHEDKESTPPHIKSTLSALINSSSRNLHKQPSEESMKRDKKKIKNNEDGSIFIKIQCFSDISDAEDDNKNYKDTPISCAKNCPSHYHVRLDGKPVTLKMNQNNAEEGAVYCINTGSDDNDNDIRIVIKQCPECRSTVIASSSRIQGFGGESHESITLHGKGGDETDMTYSSDGSNNMCTCHDKGVIYINISRVRCDDRYTPPCSCSESEGHRSQRKLDVVIDTDNVDQSTVKVRSESSIASIHDSDSKPTSFTRAKSSVDHIHGKNVAIKPEPGIPLTRRRICSSMEFDVSTVHSRLRDREIEHGNAHIVVELKKLGVDKILRACRPAKCCRQAILDEKQRTALPYCVSLKSLPLMGNDAEVIKQSIDMSVKKIKNSLDLTQAYKDKLAFYVSLGKDDFKPNVNFPWVVPVYDLKLDQNSRITRRNEEKLFILKKTVTTPKQLGSLNKLIGISKTQQTDSQITNTRKTIHRKKYYILKRPKIVQPVVSTDSRSPVVRRKVSKQTNKRRPVVIQFKNQNKLNDNENNNSSTKVLKCNQTRIYKRKHIWSNIGYGDWRIAFARENRDVFCRKKIDLSYVDFHFGQSKELSNIVDLSGSKKKRTNNYIKEQYIRNCLDSGDCSFASLGNMFETYLDKIQENDDIKGESVSAKFSNIQECKEKRIVSPKSLPTFWKHISEELFYASNALTVFFKRRRSLGKVQISHESKLEEKSCKHFSSRCLPKCEEKKSKKSVKKKMEYYVSLINGDLVWGEALPLLPQNYDTYYNYSNHNDKEPTPPSTPVEDPMVATRVTNDTSHRAYSRAATPSENEYQNQSDSPDDRSIISELITDPDNMPLESQEKNNDSPKSKFPPFSMGPESLYAPWSPFLVSEHSLPRIREEVIEKEEAPPVEAEPVPAKEETKPKSKCSSKSVCVRNSCVKCKSKECQGKPSTSKKGHPRDAIRIAIKKTKDNGICVEGKAPKACNKEICEIYKNKSMMPDKSAKHRDRDQTFKISGKDNIEIYINNQKICVANNKNKKSTKSNNSKYEDSQRYEKNERMEKNEKTGNNEKMEKNEKTGKNEKMDK